MFWSFLRNIVFGSALSIGLTWCNPEQQFKEEEEEEEEETTTLENGKYQLSIRSPAITLLIQKKGEWVYKVLCGWFNNDKEGGKTFVITELTKKSVELKVTNPDWTISIISTQWDTMKVTSDNDTICSKID